MQKSILPETKLDSELELDSQSLYFSDPEIIKYRDKKNKPTGEKEYSLIKRAKQGDREAIEELFMRHQGTVVFFAKKYLPKRLSHFELMDLIQIGNIALIKALSRFDLSRSLRFREFASIWVEGEISRAVRTHSRDLSVSVLVGRMIGKINRERFSYIEEFGHEPSQEEIADKLNISLKRIKEIWPAYLSYRNGFAVVDDNDGDGGDEEDNKFDFDDFSYHESNSNSPEEILIRKESAACLVHAIENLPPLQKETILLRIAPYENLKSHTFEEIGDFLGHTGPCIRAREQNAMKNIVKEIQPFL